MKNHIRICMLCALFAIAAESKSQFTFSASPGLHINGATFGFRSNRIVPFFGMQVFGTKSNYDYTYSEFSSAENKIVEVTETHSSSITAFLPVIGVKYFFGKLENIKPYGIFSVSRAFLTGSLQDSDDPTAAQRYKDDLKATKAAGTQFGFGTEYFFNEHFSFGGEFGLRVGKVSSTRHRPREVYDPNLGTSVQTTSTSKDQISLSPTYVKFSFNFYFGK